MTFREKLKRGIIISSGKSKSLLPKVETTIDGFFGGDLKISDGNFFLLKSSRNQNSKANGFVR